MLLMAADGDGAVDAVVVELVHAAANKRDTRHGTRDMRGVVEGVTATVPEW